MILTVTANVALDRTYVIDHLQPGAVHKVREVYAQAGGKGINVSRTLVDLGGTTLVTGLVGTDGLQAVELDLRRAALPSALHQVSGSARQTVTVHADDGVSTALDEPGPTITDAEWLSFEGHVRGLLDGADLLVLAGSLPPGSPTLALQHLVAMAHARDLNTIVDARGAAMQAALVARPLIAKLNRAELGETLGRECRADQEVIAAAQELREMGAQAVIVTLGAAGAIAVDSTATWRVTHPSVSGNPIGAGDAFTAGVALKLSERAAFREALRYGAAAAITSLRSPTAGRVELADVQATAPDVNVHAVGEAETAS